MIFSSDDTPVDPLVCVDSDEDIFTYFVGNAVESDWECETSLMPH